MSGIAEHSRAILEAEQRLLTDHQIDFADVFQGVVLEVDEVLGTEVEQRLTVGGESCAAASTDGVVSLTDERG